MSFILFIFFFLPGGINALMSYSKIRNFQKSLEQIKTVKSSKKKKKAKKEELTTLSREVNIYMRVAKDFSWDFLFFFFFLLFEAVSRIKLLRAILRLWLRFSFFRFRSDRYQFWIHTTNDLIREKGEERERERKRWSKKQRLSTSLKIFSYRNS